MSGRPPARAHLVERAIEALGGTGLASPEPPPPPAAPAPPPARTTVPLAEQAVAALGGPGMPSAAAVVGKAPAAPATTPPAVPDAAPAVPLAIMERAGLCISARNRNRISEEITVVQHQILRSARSAPPAGRGATVVLVTSARPNEGKTFCALNIAAAMAIHGGQPVVLVDTDGKRGSISELLGCSGQPGLRALAADPRMAPTASLVRTAIASMQFLPIGSAAEAAAVAGAPILTAIRRMAAALPDHVIVLDTPPCLSTSDPSTLAAVASQVVMVVEAERTQRNEVEAALDMMDASPVIQLLLNRVSLNVSDAFGAYGDYGAYGAKSGS